MRLWKLSLPGLGLAALAGTSWAAGTIVVNNDEWTLSNTGYASPSDPGVFALNVANLFTGGGAGSFRAWSGNFGLTQSSLAGTMTGAGHSWTVSTAGTFNLATLQSYDGIFLAGSAAGISTSVLISYVQAGGKVYLAGGTGGPGGAPGEAAYWNPFLNAFGLAFTSPYNGIAGHIAIASGHPIFAGVDHLYQNNGSSLIDLEPSNPNNEILVTHTNGAGLYGIYVVPEPATFVGIGLGLAALRGRRLRRR